MNIMKQQNIILAIETSLDETCAAVILNDRVLSNVISSQVELHKKYGGVVPIIAKRAHIDRIDAVITEALKQANTITSRFNLEVSRTISPDTIDAIAVTAGPGQALALEVGIQKAKEISIQYTKPLIAVSHMEGHLLSSLAKNSVGNNRRGIAIEDAAFPMIGLLVSGGHTQLVLARAIGEYELFGKTLDDAAGEAFDKVGRMLGLGYPGGPIIEHLAKKGDEHAFDLPVPMINRDDLDFSFSGLKTAVRYKIRDLKNQNSWSKQAILDMAASFQYVLTKSLTHKLTKAVKQYKPHGILLGGGVISSIYVRNHIRTVMRRYNTPVYIPYSDILFTDNAAMIGLAGYCKAKHGKFVSDIYHLERIPTLSF